MSLQAQRFWFGTALAIGPVVALLLAITLHHEDDRRISIEGHVSSRGRPLAGGIIAFIPRDPRDGNGPSGRIDEGGHFSIRSGWHRGALTGRVGFQIWVRPDGPAGPGRAAEPRAGAGPVGCPGLGAASDVPRQSSPADSRPLEVWLDSGPAHVDIAL
jgi:hypothetical protein